MRDAIKRLVRAGLTILVLIAAVSILSAINTHNRASSAGATQYISGPPGGDDCQATQIATDGTPPAGVTPLDPQKLCDALTKAEQESACMGDWQPPEQISARELCIETQRHGCDPTGRNCNLIPADQTYYHHR